MALNVFNRDPLFSICGNDGTSTTRNDHWHFKIQQLGLSHNGMPPISDDHGIMAIIYFALKVP